MGGYPSKPGSSSSPLHQLPLLLLSQIEKSSRLTPTRRKTIATSLMKEQDANDAGNDKNDVVILGSNEVQGEFDRQERQIRLGCHGPIHLVTRPGRLPGFDVALRNYQVHDIYL
ncbi:hypothetical protein K504DRAFT_459697 [Pleomassaria siparia CBS 279.74]|uniref:Uncharacterized protein n=1 Tax=Pleomassaria siparia CBS 279.74 TaxID=1314801 RepID=A0A6G1K1L4_9PLEO|nr:hypothetical protein K504DRAFT_459697 [Pleomassaria siparia CBS 279.74]